MSSQTTLQFAETTEHYQRIRQFMLRGAQDSPLTPILPTPEVALLRAKLIFEEALETIDALGVTVYYVPGINSAGAINDHTTRAQVTHEPNLVEIADGCADVSVVTMGTLIACGIPDQGLLELVDGNNLDKFRNGLVRDESGKIIKPADHRPPDIAGYLNNVLPLETMYTPD